MNTNELLLRLEAAKDDARMRRDFWLLHAEFDPMIERLIQDYSSVSVTLNQLINRYQGNDREN